MKKMKKLVALIIATAMVLSMMSIAAFAEDTTTYQITVDTTKDKSTHTYKIYQIYTGTPGTEGLTDVQYGSSYPGGKTGAVPSDELKAITDARAWATANKDNLGDAVYTIPTNGNSYDAKPGWYLILDTEYEGADEADAYSAFMLKVVDQAVTFVPKKEVPSVDKKVKDEEDDAEEGATNGWGETADHEIGETFQFQLKAEIPANGDLKAYKEYSVKFTDTMSNGVTFEKINSVKVNGTAIDASAYTTTATAGQAGGSWTLTIADIKKIEGVDLGDSKVTIEVEYDAHLNSAATVNTESGTTDNKNTVKLTYSNNPDATGTGNTDDTPEDDVWVFTYGNTGTKTDANGTKLAGAGFKLYSGKTEGTTQPTGTAISLYKVGNDYFVYDSSKNDYPADGEVVTEMLTTADGVFNIKGIDVGEYTLYESTVPEGYVQSENISFKIGATHEEDSTGGKVTFTEGTSTAETIVNRTGSTLPSTGGIGTTIFYIVGAILVIGAGVVLVTRRRMEA